MTNPVRTGLPNSGILEECATQRRSHAPVNSWHETWPPHLDTGLYHFNGHGRPMVMWWLALDPTREDMAVIRGRMLRRRLKVASKLEGGRAAMYRLMHMESQSHMRQL